MLEDSAVPNSTDKGPLPASSAGIKMLSEWRRLEKQMIGDHSPPKQSLLGRLNEEEIKGDTHMPDFNDNGKDLEAYSATICTD